MKTLPVCLFISLIVMVSAGPLMAQAATELLWSFPTGWQVNSVAPTGDVSGNGIGDVLAGVSDDHVYCIEGGGPLAGTLLWSMPAGGDVWIVAAIADVNGDGRDDCLAGASDNTVTCISGHPADGGAPIWSALFGGDIWSLAAIGDVDDDGLDDCLAGSADNTVSCISGGSSGAGQIVWQYAAGGDIRSLSRMADVNGDGRDDCLAGASDNTVYCLSGKAGPRLIWSYPAGGDVWTVAALADVSGDGRDDCLAGTGDNRVLCLSGADGALLWSFSTGGDVWSVAATGDVNGDGTADCLAGSADNKAYAISGADGAKLWEVAFGGDVWAVAALDDIDGDARHDGVCGTGADDVAVIGGGGPGAGQILWSEKTVGGVRSVAACGDLNGNGCPDVITGSTDSYIRAYEGNTIMAGVAAAESLALVDLYHSAGGDAWLDRTGWLDQPVIGWHGVTVVDHQVVAVQLDANGLSGSLPSSIGDLVHLEVLGLAANDLSGAIPAQISGLTNLRGLYLQDNRLSGDVPGEVAGLSQLQHLWIQSNRLADLPGLGSPGSLDDLRIQSNRFTFEDIEPNASVSGGVFLYSPQDSVGQAADTTVAPEQSLTFSVPAAGTQTQYQWTRDGADIPGAVQASHTIVSASAGDAGSYVCRMTNPLAPELTLFSRPVRVSVSRVIEPAPGVLWVAGRTNVIRWQVPGSTVTITLSRDGGQSFDQIIEPSLTNTGQYSWDVPDTILSRTCRIRVAGDGWLPAAAVSGEFRIKPHRLTRLTPGGQYEPYRPDEDAWSFGDEGAVLWPPAWWGGDPPRFDYIHGVDPYTGRGYPDEFAELDPAPETFPDWPLWVGAFGTDRCYWDASGGRYRQAAIAYWDACRDGWPGSSGGLAVSGFMAFDDAARFQGAFPVGSFGDLHDLPIDDDRRETINLLQTRLFGMASREHLRQNWDKTPRETLDEVREMLLGETGDHRVLYIADQQISAARAVNPISAARSSFVPGTVELAVYDPRTPGEIQTVRIDTVAGTWAYVDGWGGSRGLFLMEPVSGYYNEAGLSKGGACCDRATTAGAEKTAAPVELYASPQASIRIVDPNGDSLGYAAGAGFGRLPGGIPIIPARGSAGPPTGYLVPPGEYAISLSDFPGPRVLLRAFAGSVLYAYRRDDAAAGQADRLFCGDGLGLRHADEGTRNVTLKALLMAEDDERIFDLIDIAVSPGDSLHLEAVDGDDLRIVNAGDDSAYDLRLTLVSSTRRCLFQHGRIALSGHSAHLISPDWEDLEGQPVVVSIDDDGDGSIDRSVTIYNERTAVEGPATADLPDQYGLSQNYPNPFNPRTVLNYRLPQPGPVRLVVYNVLGQRVTTLVHSYLPAGHHSAAWDAAGFASGVYFARLEAGAYSRTVKMLLLR